MNVHILDTSTLSKFQPGQFVKQCKLYHRESLATLLMNFANQFPTSFQHDNGDKMDFCFSYSKTII